MYARSRALSLLALSVVVPACSGGDPVGNDDQVVESPDGHVQVYDAPADTTVTEAPEYEDQGLLYAVEVESDSQPDEPVRIEFIVAAEHVEDYLAIVRINDEDEAIPEVTELVTTREVLDSGEILLSAETDHFTIFGVLGADWLIDRLTCAYGAVVDGEAARDEAVGWDRTDLKAHCVTSCEMGVPECLGPVNSLFFGIAKEVCDATVECPADAWDLIGAAICLLAPDIVEDKCSIADMSDIAADVNGVECAIDFSMECGECCESLRCDVSPLSSEEGCTDSVDDDCDGGVDCVDDECAEVDECLTPPSAPTGLAANYDDGDETIGLAWSSSAGAEEYQVYWKVGPGVTTSSAALPSTGVPEATHEDISAGTEYCYAVAASNAAGTSDLSAETCETVPWSSAYGVDLTAPTGGETWQQDDTYEITWDSTLPSGDTVCVRICEGSAHTGSGSGDTCVSVECYGTDDESITGITLDAAAFPASNEYYVTINDFDGYDEDIGGYFTIEAPTSSSYTVALTSPVGGETWQQDDTYEITWDSTLPSGDTVCVRICEGSAHTGSGSGDTCVSVECYGTDDESITGVTLDAATFPASTEYYVTINDSDGYDDDIGGYFTIEAPLPLSVGCGGDHSTLQDAVDAASSGDTITICAGTYSDATIIDATSLSIIGDGEATTVLTAPVGDTILIIRNGASVSLADLSIQDGVCASRSYCGLYVSSSTADLSSVAIDNISGQYSPGLKASSSTVTLDRVSITNVAETGGTWGAGLAAFWSTVTATDSVISGNTASGEGGGIYAEGSTIDLTDTLVSSNVAGDYGGGLYVRSSSSLVMSGGEISYNEGSNGGGLYVGAWTTASLDSVDIKFNEATVDRGGAFYVRAEGGSSETSEIDVTTCDFGSGASENTPLDVEIQDTSGTEDYLDYTGSQSFTCTVASGTCL